MPDRAAPSSAPGPSPRRRAELEQAAAKRILVLDGAMGTMLQRYKFQEADFRGTRFADWLQTR